MPAELKRLEYLMRVLSNQRRLEILQLLLASKAIHVGEISERLSIPFKTASRNLMILQRSGFVEAKPKGTYVAYSIRRSRLDRWNAILLGLVAEIEKRPRQDAQRKKIDALIAACLQGSGVPLYRLLD